MIKLTEIKAVKEEGHIPQIVGRLLRKAGYHLSKLTVAPKKYASFVENSAVSLSYREIKELSRQAVHAPAKENDKPSYAELVEILEKQNDTIAQLQDEIRQLRLFQGNNGMGERARKALVNAKRTLDIYGD